MTIIISIKPNSIKKENKEIQFKKNIKKISA